MARVSPQQIAASVTRVVEKKGTAGTAFAVGPSHLLTALHVAERGEGIARPDGSIVFFDIVDRQPELDLALIAVEAHGLLPLPLTGHVPESGALDAMGFPAIEGVEGAWGRAQAFPPVTLTNGARAMQYSSYEITYGFSGAPLVDLRRGVVAIVTHIIDVPQKNGALAGRLQTTAYAAYVADASDLLEGVGLGFVTDVAAEDDALVRETTALRTRSLSVGRCMANFRLAFDVETARQLALDESIGRPPIRIAEASARAMTFIVGEFGTGKSLALERLLQEATTAALAGDPREVVYVDARGQDIDTLLSRLEASPAPFRLFLDNAEEVGLPRADAVLRRLRALVEASPGSYVVASARPIRSFSGVSESLAMPLLTVEEGVALVARLAPAASLPLNDERRRQDSDAFLQLVRRPLFALLCGLFYSKAGNVGGLPTVGDLLTNVATEAYEKIRSEDEALLRRLAVAQIERGGEYVQLADVAETTNRARLLDAGLIDVPLDSNVVGFALPVMAQFFAAQALELGEVDLREIGGSEGRLERWRETILIRIGLASTTQADALIRELIGVSAGFAISLLTDSARHWFGGSRSKVDDVMEAGRRLRAASETWLAVFSNTASQLSIVNDGRLASLGVRSRGAGNFEYLWWNSSELGDVFVLPDDANSVNPSGVIAASFTTQLEIRPTWTWSHTLGDFTGPLVRALADGRHDLFGGDEEEMAWSAALALSGKGSLYREPLAIEPLLNHPGLHADVAIAFGFRKRYPLASLRAKLADLRAAGVTSISPPWPVAVTQGPWVWSGFTSADMEERIRVVYARGLRAYRALAERWVPRLVQRLPLYAIMPLTYHVEVTHDGSDEGYAPTQGVSYVTPEPSGAKNRVVVTRGERGKGMFHYASIMDAAWQRVPDRAWIRSYPLLARTSHAAIGFSDGVLPVHEAAPATHFAYTTLLAELKALFGR